jgi:hypothetical protein
MKHEAGLSFEMISAGKHCNITQFTAPKVLIYTGRIAERTASCYMLLLLESILFGPELLSSRFFLARGLQTTGPSRALYTVHRLL